jgi:hypothetical protein
MSWRVGGRECLRHPLLWLVGRSTVSGHGGRVCMWREWPCQLRRKWCLMCLLRGGLCRAFAVPSLGARALLFVLDPDCAACAYAKDCMTECQCNALAAVRGVVPLQAPRYSWYLHAQFFNSKVFMNTDKGYAATSVSALVMMATCTHRPATLSEACWCNLRNAAQHINAHN